MFENIEDEAISAMGTDLTESGPPGTTVSPVGRVASHDSVPPVSSYQIKPTLQDKFKANPIKEIIRETLTEKLNGKNYEAAEAKKWTIAIANTVNNRVKELHMKRYKHIVQVLLGEMKGAGVKSGVRCIWDSETDGYTSETFKNESIFCVVVVFAIYLY